MNYAAESVQSLEWALRTLSTHPTQWSHYYGGSPISIIQLQVPQLLNQIRSGRERCSECRVYAEVNHMVWCSQSPSSIGARRGMELVLKQND